MPNHVHLVKVPGEEDGLRAALGEAQRRYTGYINCREGWRGDLWQERFHSFVMDEKYLLAAVRYVERNPVAARLCGKPEQWRWSSAQAHIGGNDDEPVRVKPMWDRIGDWHSCFADSNSATGDKKLIQKHTRTGRPLGNRAFISDLELLTGKRLAPRKPGPAPR